MALTVKNAVVEKVSLRGLLRGEQKVCAPDDYNTLGYLAQSSCLAADR
jgi:hypothetical protein